MISFEPQYGMQLYKPGTEHTNFEITTMIEEWNAVLAEDFEIVDQELVSRLVAEHSELFALFALNEFGLKWLPLMGVFEIWGLTQGALPSVHALDEMWHDTFDAVQGVFDVMEEGLWAERGHGLVG